MSDSITGNAGGPAENDALGASYADPSAFVQPHNVVNFTHETPKEALTRRLTRAQVRRLREMEMEGVPFYLHKTGMEATVKALSFADRTGMGGIDPSLQQEIQAGFNARGQNAGTKGISFEDMMRGVGNEERIANACCVAGFIDPPLVMREEELASNPDAWWVEDLHVEERRAYMSLVLGQNPEEAKRITNFLLDRLENSGDS